MASSLDNKRSRYVQGGTTEEFKKRLGWWERRLIPRRDDDIIYTITSDDVGRPDLISYNVYGTAELLWLVLQYNNILDPTTELNIGTELILPSPTRAILSIITR